MDLRQDVQNRITRAKENNSSKAKRQLEVLPPLYSENHVDYPIDLTRVSPFKCIPRGRKRKYVEDILYKNQFGFVRYKGDELGIDDENIFMLLIKRAREELFAGEKHVEVRFTKREFLKELGKNISGRSAELLTTSLDRLSRANFYMESKRFKSGGNLIFKWSIDEETGEVVVRINEEWGQYYLYYGGCTQVDYKERLQLSGDITKKIHAYLQGQKNKERNYQHTFNLDLVRSITHSTSRDKKLKELTKKALRQLVGIGFLMTWREEKNCAFFVRIYPK